MDLVPIATALIGAVFGALGWFVVGMTIQRRQTERQAKSAGRAVYFELAVNGINVSVAIDHGVLQPLSRSAWDRLLPELASWLPADELLCIARAYMGHAGYEQLRQDASIPAAARRAVLGALGAAHRTAITQLRGRVFTPLEMRQMEEAGDPVLALGAAIPDERSQLAAARGHGRG